MRAHDWSRTPFGPTAAWPESLRSALSICLGSAFPIAIYWGPRLGLLYNDAWRPILGNKHPSALGEDARKVWPEIWSTIGPLFAQVLESGEATFAADSLLPMRRHGYTEECYFDFTFSPIRGADGEVAGVFNAVIETTWRVLGERRTRVLRELGEALLAADSVESACTLAMERLAAATRDVAFAAVYRHDAGRNRLQLACAHGFVEPPAPELPADDARWPFAQVLASGQTQLVADLERRLGFVPPGGAWPEPATEAVVALLPGGAGVLLIGAAPRRAVDDDYREFVERVAGHLGRAFAAAAALAAERERAEALAQLDRAKTTFFGNVSHEFRTPLTLLLGPIDDLLAQRTASSPSADRELLELVRRNARRLLKLVNTLLDYSRVEAGRAEVTFEPTDLAAFTADIASSMRSVCEQADLRLEVDCRPLGAPVWVDRAMWEKIVLNLLSNAFKFTLEGRISLTLDAADGTARLLVADTGCGIPTEELPRVFERFHRVAGTRGRSHEGSGIGLALVQELVRCHEGTIAVRSELGSGTEFTVAIPLVVRGVTAAPTRHDGDAGTVRAYVDELRSWLPDDSGVAAAAAPADTKAHRVVFADDNRDLRHYVRGLLAEHHEVEAVADGEQALAAARAQRPDLIVADVMMPGIDGLELVRRLRADPDLRTVPVLLLSARVGDEARLEALRVGADDYVQKPFHARELLVRVGALLRATTARAEMEAALRQSEQRLRTFADAAPAMLWVTAPDGHSTFRSRGWFDYVGEAQAPTDPMWRAPLHPDDRARVDALFADSHARRVPFRTEYRLRRADGAYRWVLDVGRPHLDDEGTFLGYVGSIIEVHEQREVREALRASEERYRAVVESQAEPICRFRVDGTILFANGAYARTCGRTAAELLGENFWHLVLEADRPHVRRLLARLSPAEPEIRIENRFEAADGTRWFLWTNRALSFDAEGRVLEAQATGVDITERKAAEAALHEEARALEVLNRIGRALAAEQDLERTMQLVTDAARELSGAQFGAFFHTTKDDSGERYTLYSLSGAPRAAFEAFGMPRNTALFGPTFAGERAIRLDDVTQDPRYGRSAPHHGMPAGHLAVRSYLAVPVVSRTGEVLGGLFLGHPEVAVFNARAEQIVVGVAAQASVAIDNARLHQERLQLIESLRETDRAKDEFLATLSHELRNPLAPLRNALYLLRHGGAPMLGDVQPMMERQVHHLVRLVDDLMETSRIIRGTFELRSEPTTVQDVVRDAIEACDPELRLAEHALTVQLPDAPLPLVADRVRLVQVFSNLLNNAIRYTPSKGAISIGVERANDTVVVHVRDNGDGIDADEMPRLFAMFHRGNQTSRRRQAGLGIGLALARRLVEMHGGTITAASGGKGRGSRFSVRLPLATVATPAPLTAPASDQGAPVAAANLGRILIVDDNEDGVQSLAALLGAMGADVVTAYDGEAALRAFDRHAPRVVLLDIGMPGMSGYDVARAIRARRRGADVLLVAVTGWGQDEDRRRAREAGFDRHLVKPVNLDALQELLAQQPR